MTDFLLHEPSAKRSVQVSPLFLQAGSFSGSEQVETSTRPTSSDSLAMRSASPASAASAPPRHRYVKRFSSHSPPASLVQASLSRVHAASFASACSERHVELVRVRLQESVRSYSQQLDFSLRPFTVRVSGSASTHRLSTSSHSVSSSAESAAHAPRSSVRLLRACVVVEASTASGTASATALSTHRYVPCGTHPSPVHVGALTREHPSAASAVHPVRRTPPHAYSRTHSVSAALQVSRTRLHVASEAISVHAESSSVRSRASVAPVHSAFVAGRAIFFSHAQRSR